jgi:levansucrase
MVARGHVMPYAPEDEFSAAWTREHVESIRLHGGVLAPPIPCDFPLVSDDVWMWDTWPLTDLEMRPLRVDGWQVIFSLVAPREIRFHDRHAVASIGWCSSRDGISWRYRGLALPSGTALGTRQWSGCAVLIGDRVHLFYTACGERGANDADWQTNDPAQRIALATATISTTPGEIVFSGFRFADSRIVAEADSRLYQTAEQARGSEIIYGFRDPFVFVDGGEIYMTFTANRGGPGCFTGNVGLARALDEQLEDWQLLPPLLHADGVNQQLERPHFVVRNSRHYLFFVSHAETYAPGLTGPDGLYGFVGDGLRSDYQPLNDSALVLANEPGTRPQRYADYVMPNWLVQGFIDTVGDRAGGTLAPTLRLEVNGTRALVAEQLGYGSIPAMAERTAARGRPAPQTGNAPSGGSARSRR